MAGPVVILEGPDGAGKTTLANTLAREFGYKILKHGPPSKTENLLLTYLGSLTEALDDAQPVVIDRHYLGEGVYGPLLRGKDRLGPTGRILLERAIAAWGVRVVLCLPSYMTVRKHWAEKEDLLKTEEQLGKVYDGYLTIRDKKRPFILEYDWTTDERDFFLFRRLLTPNRITLPRHVVGSPEAEVLFVGDQTNPNEAIQDLPFFSTQGCSPWLTVQAYEAGLVEKNMAFMNVLSQDGQVHSVKRVVESLPNLKAVFLLGAEARQCTDYWGKVFTLNHPQHVKRFQSKSHNYPQQIKEALRLS